jgi:predicted DNA-binding transcriptional regulator YafY
MYSPTTRLLTILERLQSRKSVSGPELAAELEVDIRSVRRYISSLRDLGIPIDGEPGRAGTYRLRPGYRLPPVMFTNTEMIAVMLGLVAVRNLGIAEACGAEDAIQKIERVLPDSLRTQAKAIQSALTFNVRSARTRVPDQVLADASLAAYQQRQLWMDYQAQLKPPSQRTVDIYGVTFHGGSWYAVGYCHLRHDFRTFRLDRIVHHRLLETTFERVPVFDAMAFLWESLSHMGGLYMTEVLIEGDINEIGLRIPVQMGELKPAGDQVLWQCQVSDLDWMARVLASIDFPVKVLDPPELQQALVDLAARVTSMIARQPAQILY